jgi:hypothetical protein
MTRNIPLATAYCNAGEKAVGGAADWDEDNTDGWPFVSYSAPVPYGSPAGSTPTGWQVEIDNASTSGGGVQAVAGVICASP